MFQELMPLLRERVVTLTVSREDDETILVNVIPKKLKEGENEALTRPLSIRGNPAEIDAELPAVLARYTEAHNRFAVNLSQIEEELEAAAKKAKDDAKAKLENKADTKAKTPAKRGRKPKAEVKASGEGEIRMREIDAEEVEEKTVGMPNLFEAAEDVASTNA